MMLYLLNPNKIIFHIKMFKLKIYAVFLNSVDREILKTDFKIRNLFIFVICWKQILRWYYDKNRVVYQCMLC